MKTKLAPLAAALVIPSIAAAQVTYGTDDVSSSDNFELDIATGVSTGPAFTGIDAWGIADDSANATLYINDGSALATYPIGALGGAVTPVGDIVDAGGALFPMTGLAFDNGVLYGHRNIAVEGLYTIDLVTLEATVVTTYASTAIDLGGLDFDPATGLLYCSNDGLTYADPQGNIGRGVVVIDPGTLSESLDFPYPAGETDIDGLAFDAATNAIYLLEDEPAPLHRYDIGAMAFDANPPMNAILGSEVFSAGTYTGGSTQATLGTPFCAANPNSTGVAGQCLVTGSDQVADNNVTLRVAQVPANEFGIFVVSPSAGGIQVVNQGVLCLTGPTGRYSMPGQIWQADGSGAASLAIDLTMIPTPTALVGTNPGDTWFFQAWHRDVPPAGAPAGSNFTAGTQVTFN